MPSASLPDRAERLLPKLPESPPNQSIPIPPLSPPPRTSAKKSLFDISLPLILSTPYPAALIPTPAKEPYKPLFAQPHLAARGSSRKEYKKLSKSCFARVLPAFLPSQRSLTIPHSENLPRILSKRPLASFTFSAVFNSPALTEEKANSAASPINAPFTALAKENASLKEAPHSPCVRDSSEK